MKKSYSDEFKRDAIGLQETSGKSVGEIERELGLSHNLLRQWKKRYQVEDETSDLERIEVEQLKVELRQAKRELEIARHERDILKNYQYLLEGSVAMTPYEQVEACAADFPVVRVCAVLDVSESGHYGWKQRLPSPREQRNKSLQTRIEAIWQACRQCYGALRIHAQLQAQGYGVGKNRVARLMQKLGIRGKGGQKRRPHTTQPDASHPVMPNVLDRQFDVDCPDQVWLTDITYIKTEEGFLYTAGVMDLYSRQIVGLAMAKSALTTC